MTRIAATMKGLPLRQDQLQAIGVEVVAEVAS